MTVMPHLASLTWDEDDRLRSTYRQALASGTPKTAWYTYAASGQRVRKLTDRQTLTGQQPTRQAERIYLGPVEIYREYAADGITVTLERETLHVTDGDNAIALIETRTTGTDKAPAQLVRYQLSNHLGSAALELDDQSAILSYEEYFPYGSTSYQAVASQTDLPRRYRYTGKERDTENDLYYHGARYYIPWLGRWTSCDPAGMADGPNPYAYARDTPARMTDPDGKQSAENSGNAKEDPKPAEASADSPCWLRPASTRSGRKSCQGRWTSSRSTERNWICMILTLDQAWASPWRTRGSVARPGDGPRR